MKIKEQLSQFKKELEELLDDNQQNSYAQILLKIEKSGYNYNREYHKDLKQQNISALVQIPRPIVQKMQQLVDSVGTSAILLTRLPFIPSYFVGREDDFEAVHSKLFAGKNLIMLVNGQGGIGKSAFAGKYWERYECKYQFLISLFAGNGILDALLSLDRKLGIEFEPTMPNEKRLEILIERVQALDKPCLLLLDNVDKANYLDETYHALHECKNFHILITSRLNQYKGVEKYKVGALDKETAFIMFKEFYKRFDAKETEFFYEVFDYVEGNTLVIELFAKNLDKFHQIKKYYSLEALVQDVKKGITKLEKQAEVEVDYHRKGFAKEFSIPEKVILSMYDLTALQENEIGLLSVLAVLPAENIKFETLTEILQNDDLDTPLLALAQKGWIDYNEAQASFKISPVVQEITRHKNKERLFEDCEKMIRFLIDRLSYHPGLGALVHVNHEQGGLYAKYVESILLCFENTQNTYILNLCSALYERIGNFNKAKGDLNKALEYFEKCNVLAEKIHRLEPNNVFFANGLAISYSKLGEVYTTKGDLNKASEFFEKDLEVTKKLYQFEPNNVSFVYNLAVSYEKLGGVYKAKGDLYKALKFFEKTNELGKKLYQLEPNNVDFAKGLAVSYEKLGGVYTAKGDLNKALEFFKKHNELFEKINQREPNNVGFAYELAASYEMLGEVYKAKGDLNKALEFFEKSNELTKKLNQLEPNNVDFANGLAISYMKLYFMYLEKENKTQQAKAYLEKAVAIFENLANNFTEYPDFRKRFEASKQMLDNLK